MNVPMPPRPAWICRSGWLSAAGGRPAGCSRQAWGLREKLPPANELYAWNGQMARRALLARAGIALPDNLADAANIPPDGILDAGAVAWSAARIAAGQGSSLPDPPQAGADDAQIAIWF
jgi:hypothetical protein